IDGKRTHITNDTLIDNAVIKSAHIDELSGRKITAESITTDKLDVTTLSAITAELGSVTGGTITQESSGYKIVMERGTIKTYINNVLRSTTTGGGSTYHRDGYDVGSIGTSNWVGDSSYRGLSFQLDSNANYMTWSHRERPGDDNFTTMLT